MRRVLVLLALSVLGQLAGAGLSSAPLSWAAAGLGAAVLVAHGMRQRGAGSAIALAAANARLLAMAFAWGAVTLLAVYTLSGVWWQHGRQYGLGMAAIAGLAALYAYGLGVAPQTLGRPRFLDAAAALVALLGLGALEALAVFAMAGKLASAKADWPANIVFIAGGLTIAALAAIAVGAHIRLRRRGG